MLLRKMREPVSGLIHLFGAFAAAVGLSALVVPASRPFPETLALLVYGSSMLVLFLASSAYHLVNASPGKVAALRKLDHAAIYLLIAGTYTPFCIIAFDGFWKWGFLALIWSLALVGIIVKIFFIAPRWVNVLVYVIMGWLSVLAAGEITAALSTGAVGWLVAGGLIYTLGAVIYVTRRLDFVPGIFGFHEVWHIFVLLGAAAHYAAVFQIA
jgi:hemolysin III